MDGFVNVAVRIRPTFKNNFCSTIKLISENPWTLQIDERSQYTVDRIFTEDTGQLEIYNVIVRPLIEKVRLGYNSTVFAYGQTGTGKTYTMGSNPEAYETDEPGFILCSISNFIENLSDNTEIYISFFEIYNEKIYDLLSTNKKMLPIKGIQDLMKEKLIDLAQAKSILRRGSANRHVGETKQNSKSSRSHAILTIHFSSCYQDTNISAKLNLVDLAGSESVKKTGNQGYQFQEGVNINKGLLSIGRVVNALATNVSFIPYRESKITTILQDSLNRNNYVTLIACISPNPDDIRETIQTMEFTQETKKIKHRPEFTSLLSTQKKKSVYRSSKRHIPQNIFEIVSKKPKLVDMACSPIKPLKKKFIAIDEFNSSISVLSEINFNVSKADISPIIVKHVEKELSKFKEKSSQSINSGGGEADFSANENMFQSTMIENSRCPTPNENNNSQKLIISLVNSIKTSAEIKTPSNRFSWRKLEALIAQTVRNEILQFTNRKPIACNSPIHVHQPKKIDFQMKENAKENFPFKIPAVPSETKSNIKYRGSLQTKTKKDNDLTFNTPRTLDKFVEGELNGSQSIYNESSRISEKAEKIPTRRSERILSKALANNERSLRVLNGNKGYGPLEEFNIVEKTKTNKKSNRQICKKCDKIDKENFFNDTVNSPKTSNKNYILHILNNGSEAELQKLATIGSKTATKIYMYRKINGQFNDITDIQNTTGIWRGKGFSRFLKENFIE
ncbi:chromosome-associated kinesin KIF4B-like [Agrilus planipennis]|uniref:Kinesin-like protein n=1 Tax=Agrilus planipennis TaxID=224129 RepID=A0A7F5RK69_AGRPL|nr:chromosome-associated kinesin KIF4B-like [Agrilus planipennis]